MTSIPRNIVDKPEANQETVHVVLSIWDLTDTYNRHASVTMISILENTQRPVCFHLLYDKRESDKDLECAERNRQRYLEIGKKYNSEILFHHVEVPESALKNKLLKIYTVPSKFFCTK